MWYFIIGAILGAWVVYDANKRKFGVWSFVYGLFTLLFWPLALAIYNARKPLHTGETRQGGTAWNIIRALIFWWTILMVAATVIGVASTSETLQASQSDAELAGMTIGASLGVGILCAIWFIPTIVALVLALVLRSSIVEEGPTGRLAIESNHISTAKPKRSKAPSATELKLREARDLIKQKDYSEARALLKTIDHPKAREWLARIDQLEADDEWSI